MFGPAGTCGLAGAAPRPSGIRRQKNPVELSVHEQPPATPLMPPASTTRGAMFAASVTSSRMLLSVVCVIAIFVLSGEKDALSDPSVTSITGRSVPVATSFAMMRWVPPITRGPLLRGLMRDPARPIHGAVTSASVGMLLRYDSSIVLRSRESETAGAGSALMMSATTLGGVL